MAAFTTGSFQVENSTVKVIIMFILELQALSQAFFALIYSRISGFISSEREHADAEVLKFRFENSQENKSFQMEPMKENGSKEGEMEKVNQT